MSEYSRFRAQRRMRQAKRFGRRIRSFWRFNLWSKWRQLAMIRRFAFIWVALIAACLLGTIWQIRHVALKGSVLQPLQGGSYTEGEIGTIKTINPVLPDNAASADAVRLVFNGLTRFDANGELQPDLATGWTVSPDGKTYTFKLRTNVHWHDGVPFTAQDVVFTITAIQNPDTRSPLASDWQGVKASAPDDKTVVMVLPRPFTPFINTTTTGILPRHLLEGVEPGMLRVSTFNQKPIGTGPFKLQSFDSGSGQVALAANNDYYNGRPYLDSITFRSYETSNLAYQAYSRREVQGISHLSPQQLNQAARSGTMRVYEAGEPNEVGVFLHVTSPQLADRVVRAALAQATDRRRIIDDVLSGQATALASPLATSKVNLAGSPHQAAFNLEATNQALDAAGWKRGSDGVRVKNKLRLELKLVTQSGTTYGEVAKQIADQWGRVGVKVDVVQVEGSTLQQSYIRSRHYDAILYGINVGTDPDVYAYWHSSQASNPGLNLSSYSSTAADRALEAGRTLRDNGSRSAKYRSFIQTWVADNPAIMLYTPNYLYGVDRSVHGIRIRRLITPADRFDDAQRWSVKVRAVPAS